MLDGHDVGQIGVWVVVACSFGVVGCGGGWAEMVEDLAFGDVGVGVVGVGFAGHCWGWELGMGAMGNGWDLCFDVKELMVLKLDLE